jgi:N-acetylmuramoyl-L-alanine amidase
MEEKIVRPMSLVVALLALFICTSLYYLPGVEAKAQQYLAKQLQARKERQQREEMWAMLSGLEFLDYSTRQVLAATTGSDEEEEQDLTALDFTQQLRLELPKNVSKDDVQIENHYVTHTIDITIPGAGEDYLITYPMIGKSDHIENLQYLAGDGSGTLELSMEHVYELSLDWEEQYLYIDFVSPRDIYDKIVVIDAGHGDDMPGATVGGVEDKDIDLAIVQELKNLFDEAGDETLGVYYTRLDDTNPAFADRSGLANDVEANLFVSVHNNSYTASEDVNGTAVLFDEKKETEGNSSKHLANILLEQTCEALGSKNMGLVNGNDIYIIRTSDAPVALVEVGFMTNPNELKKLTSEAYQKTCAEGIYGGILQALEEGY